MSSFGPRDAGAELQVLESGEDRVLELVATGAPLSQTLTELALLFESHAEGMYASILLVEDGCVRQAAAPSLPAGWASIVDGQPIGPDRGSCGAAAYLKEVVIASDIATDPRWVSYRAAALGLGLRACWSTPILGPRRQVFGTFAFYHSEPREPTPHLLALATRASRLATVAIQRHLHQAALEETEESARLIVENALDAVVQMDQNGHVTAWNPRASAIFGFDATQAKGRKLSELIVPERLRQAHEQGLARFLATREARVLNRRLELTALHADGHEFPIELAVTPLWRGDKVTFCAFVRDITETKRSAQALAESQHHLSLVYDHSADALYQLSVEPGGYRFVSVNPAFTQATGLPAELVNGKLVHEVIPEPSCSLVLAKYAEAIRTRVTVRWEEATEYPSGLRHGDVAITPVFNADGQPKYLIGSVRDVTLQREMAGEITELRERQRLHAVLDVTPSAVAITRDNRVSYANPRFRELFGLGVGDDPSACQVDAEGFRRVLADVAAGGVADDVACQAHAADGSLVDLLATYRYIEHEGEPSALAHFVDVTAMKSTERQLVQVSERLRMATRGASIGIWSMDFERKEIEWDDVMHELYGVERSPGLNYLAVWRAAVHPEDRARIEQRLVQAYAGGAAFEADPTLDAEFRVFLRDGSLRYARANAVLQRNASGRVVRMVGTNWDITHAKRAEEALREAKEQAEAATRAKSLFLANMSHEIRTPMNAILGYAQLLHRDQALGAAQKKSLEVIHSSGQHLLLLINDILEMSKIEAGHATLVSEPFDLRGLLRDVQRMFAGLAEERSLELAFIADESLPLAVHGDPVKVRQVLINLLSNATKFSARGRVQVRGSASRLPDERWQISLAVADAGPGIPAADLSRIFNAFDQAASGLKSGGTGLGLAISAHFARLMSGSIEVESTLGQGSTFVFSFPAADASRDERFTDPGEPTAVGIQAGELSPKVLIVDDVATNRDLLVELLSSIGFETRVAAGGQTALDVHDAWQPALVLMDLRMPGMTGFEAITRLRAAGSRAAIIAITASALADAEAQAVAVGADAFLRKPYREPELLAKIADALGISYVYAPSSPPPAGPPSVRLRDPRQLRQLLAGLPFALREELRSAALDARAERLKSLAESARVHSEPAAAELTLLAESFSYEALLEALPQEGLA